MKMKRLLAWLLVLVMCFTLASCGRANDQSDASTQNSEQTTEKLKGPADEDAKAPEDDDPQSDPAKPLLYRVTDESGNIIWLFGSIHVGREEYYPLPAYVRNAFESADGLAVELDILAFEKNMGLQMKALSQLVYLDGSTIKDHIPQALYEEAVKILKKHKVYLSALDMYCPAFWASMIESLVMAELGGDADLGIDRHLIDLAYEDEKEIIEIESAEFQYRLMADFDDDIQLMMLQSAVDSYENKEEAAVEIKQLMDLWASGDEKAFEEYLEATDETMTLEEKQAMERYNQAMLTDRNLTMADYAEEALLSGEEIFICVGAAHIVGDGAVADLLAERGYSVACITQ